MLVVGCMLLKREWYKEVGMWFTCREIGFWWTYVLESSHVENLK